MSRVLWCVKCSGAFESIAGAIPAVCPGCNEETRWRTMPWLRPYELTDKDRAFLKSLRIAADSDDDAA